MYQIIDSGERTEFESGAVRDMHTGKGRMDLLPWAAIMEYQSTAKLERLSMESITLTKEYRRTAC